MNLMDYVDEKCTAFDQSFENWEDAVRSAGRLLEDRDYINEKYTQDMVQLVKECGAYMVVMPGIALAHARPNGNVKKNSIAIVTIPEGVCFGHKDNDPVKALFAIAAVNDEEHLGLFQAVANCLMIPQNPEIIEKAGSYEELRKELKYEQN